MKFELVSTNANRVGTFKLETLALSDNMKHFAFNKLGRYPNIGETFTLGTSWPAYQSNPVGATREDYETHGTLEASGIFRRIA